MQVDIKSVRCKLETEVQLLVSKLDTVTTELNSLHHQQQHQKRTINHSINLLTAMVGENFIVIRGSAHTPGPTTTSPPDLFFLVRECTSAMVENFIPDAGPYRRIITNETNKLISHTVTTSLSNRFLIVLMGYLSTGKSHTAFRPVGLSPTIMQRLPPVSLTVYQKLPTREQLGLFEPTVENVTNISSKSTQLWATESTQTNAGSTRTHLAIVISNLISNQPYRLLADVPGCEEAENMMMLNEEMANERRGFAWDNMFLRKLLGEVVLKGRQGFVFRKQVLVYKRITILNREVSTFLRSIEMTSAIRVVLGASLKDQDLLFKTAWNDVAMWNMEEDKA